MSLSLDQTITSTALSSNHPIIIPRIILVVVTALVAATASHVRHLVLHLLEKAFTLVARRALTRRLVVLIAVAGAIRLGALALALAIGI